MKMHNLTGFQRDLLIIISGLNNPYGFAIKEECVAYYCREINNGKLYYNLDTLADKGLVEKGQIDRGTNSYTLTQRGQREITARHKWEQTYVKDMVGSEESL